MKGERDRDQDLLLTYIKRTKRKRERLQQENPKIILMSATMDQHLLKEYFAEVKTRLGQIPATVRVPGRTYPVTKYYLAEILKEMDRKYGQTVLRGLWAGDQSFTYVQSENAVLQDLKEVGNTKIGKVSSPLPSWDDLRHQSLTSRQSPDSSVADSIFPIRLICSIIAHITHESNEGAVLVFLPGMSEIDLVAHILLQTCPLGVKFCSRDKYRIHKLHSSLADTNFEVFGPVSPGCRKIIVATNIAETSITIPGVTHVIDSGRVRRKVHSPADDLHGLPVEWISKSSSAQRCGRAGRTGSGFYYALFTNERYQTFARSSEPEIKRIDLSRSCLGARRFCSDLTIKDFFQTMIEPLLITAIEHAVHRLKSLGSLDDSDNLTSLGRLMESMYIDPSQAKLVLLGILFRNLELAIIFGSIEDEDDWFFLETSRTQRVTAKRSFAEIFSDHLADMNIYRTSDKMFIENDRTLPQDFISSRLIEPSSYLYRRRVVTEIRNNLVRKISYRKISQSEPTLIITTPIPAVSLSFVH